MILLADDLSGAAEVAGIVRRLGMTVGLGVGVTDPMDGVDAFVVDTETRGLAASDAARELEAVGSLLAQTSRSVAFKKVDSVMRGPVRAELEGLMLATGVRRCILLPCNPSRGRTVRGGVYHVDGVPLDQTEFGADPTHPARSADVVDMLGSGSLNVASASAYGPLPDDGIIVGDAVDAADVAAWSRRLEPGTLAAGAADFVTAVLGAPGFAEPTAPRAPCVGVGERCVLVSGSTSAASRVAVTRLRKEGAAVVLVPPAPIGPEVDGFARCARTAVAIDPNAAQAEPVALLGLLVSTASTLLTKRMPDVVLLEGGSTAAAVAQALGWRRFRVEGELAPGIVALRPTEAPTPRVVIKPGSYVWPDGVMCAPSLETDYQ